MSYLGKIVPEPLRANRLFAGEKPKSQALPMDRLPDDGKCFKDTRRTKQEPRFSHNANTHINELIIKVYT